MLAGTLTGGGDWGESASMARAIEEALVSAGVIDLKSDTADAAMQRRKSFIALSTGIITHLTAKLTLTFAAGDLKTSSDAGTAVPSATKSLTGKAS
jgi:hypothetical protein